MLKSHFEAIESKLKAQFDMTHNMGHATNKGSSREVFIKEFLKHHLSERIGIGTGEIIDANSKPGDARNQHDIIIYKNDYPKLHFDNSDIDIFLAESVLATIEIKSTLDEAGIK